MQLKSFLKFVVGVIIVGLLVNLLSDYVDSVFPDGRRIVVLLTLSAIGAWLCYLLSRTLYTYVTDGRYAIEAIILNSRNEILLFSHPVHKVMLPPGGRVNRNEFPDEALRARLEERIALGPSDYRFDPLLHRHFESTGAYIGQVLRLPAPVMVQKELHRQRTLVRFHYCLLYVLRVVDDHVPIKATKFAPTQWVNRASLDFMVQTGKTFPDVLDTYDRIMAEIAAPESR